MKFRKQIILFIWLSIWLLFTYLFIKNYNPWVINLYNYKWKNINKLTNFKYKWYIQILTNNKIFTWNKTYDTITIPYDNKNLNDILIFNKKYYNNKPPLIIFQVNWNIKYNGKESKTVIIKTNLDKESKIKEIIKQNPNLRIKNIIVAYYKKQINTNVNNLKKFWKVLLFSKYANSVIYYNNSFIVK